MARGAAVLTYHKLGAPPKASRDPFLYTQTAEFNRQLAALAATGRQPIRLGDLTSAREFPGEFAITFDDGFQNVLEHGLAILSRHKMPAIQFIVSGYIGRQNDWDIAKGDAAERLMDAAQIREWLEAGHEIGSHSMTHPNLKTLSAAEAREEISSSKKSLEDQFGVAVRHFCYPFGGWTPQVRDIVVEAGYQTSCTVEFGVNDAATDPFTLRRIIPLSRADVWRKVLHRLAQKARLS